MANPTSLYENENSGKQPIGTLYGVLESLEQAGVRYCRWKGNYSIEGSLVGREDLDVLVDTRDFGVLAAIHFMHGFKLAESPTSRRQAGVFHFLGHDASADRLINIHVYSRLVVGEEFDERWALPFERVLLTDTRLEEGLRLPAKEAELVTFVLRHMVRQGTLLDLMLLRRKRSVRKQEMDWLLHGVDVENAVGRLRQSFPEVDDQDFKRAVELMRRDGGTLRTLGVAGRVRRSLRKYRRHARLFGMMRRAAVILRMLVNRFPSGRKHMRLVGGGKVIALVGPQATGKSTIARSLRDWLGAELEVHLIHAGKPPTGLMTALPTALIPAVKRVAPNQATSEIDRKLESGSSLEIPHLFLFRKLMLGWDRRRLLRRAYRRSRQGAVVVSDRYPSDTPGAIDSASFALETLSKQPRLKQRLMRWESRLYQDIASPDLVIQLTLPVDKAVIRNRERAMEDAHTTEYVLQRHATTTRPGFAHCPVLMISTDGPLDQTLNGVKNLVWPFL